jgi:hypothetical protein
VVLLLGSKRSEGLPKFGLEIIIGLRMFTLTCLFIILLLDLYEEYNYLTEGERRLRALCRDQLAMAIA